MDPGLKRDARPLSRPRRWLRAGVQRLLGQWVFDFGAALYNAANSNQIWQASCARLLDGLDIQGEGCTVLDLGTGPGVSALSMGEGRPGLSFLGLDVSHQMLRLAHRNREEAGWPARRLLLVQGDAARLPLPGGAFHGATGHSFLYLLPDHPAALHEAHRVLRPGGVVAFLEPYAGRVDWSWLLRQRSPRLLLTLPLWRFYNWIHGRFSEDTMRRTLEDAGFIDVQTEVTLGGFGIYGRARKP